MPLTPELAKWREQQVAALIDLGDSPQDAELFVDQSLATVADPRTQLPSESEWTGQVPTITDADVMDARIEWMVRVKPEWKRLLDAQERASDGL